MTEMRDILLVDDDPNDVELALEGLARFDLVHRITIARDGEEALDMLRRRGEYRDLAGGDPAVVVLDLKMPKIDGMEVLRAIRNDRDLGLLPVVILTSSRQDRDIIEAYGLGANSYVVKPMDFRRFADVVGSIGQYWGALNESAPAGRRCGRHRHDTAEETE